MLNCAIRSFMQQEKVNIVYTIIYADPFLSGDPWVRTKPDNTNLLYWKSTETVHQSKFMSLASVQ